MAFSYEKVYRIECIHTTTYHMAGERKDEMVLESGKPGDWVFVEKGVADEFGTDLDLCDDDDAFFTVSDQDLENASVIITEIL